MKTKTLRLALIDAINYEKDGELLGALLLAIESRNKKVSYWTRVLRKKIAEAIRIQRKNERERRIEKEEEKREWEETIRKQRIADAIYTGRTQA